MQNVSLAVRKGEAVGLLGPNGAGKTTVFYMITGLVQPDKGMIELDGNDVTAFPMYQRARLGIGYLPQKRRFFVASQWKTIFARFWRLRFRRRTGRLRNWNRFWKNSTSSDCGSRLPSPVGR